MHFRVLAQRYLEASCRVNVRFGSKADMCGATRDVRYGPKADIGKPIRSTVSTQYQSRRNGVAH